MFGPDKEETTNKKWSSGEQIHNRWFLFIFGFNKHLTQETHVLVRFINRILFWLVSCVICVCASMHVLYNGVYVVTNNNESQEQSECLPD